MVLRCDFLPRYDIIATGDEPPQGSEAGEAGGDVETDAGNAPGFFMDSVGDIDIDATNEGEDEDEDEENVDAVDDDDGEEGQDSADE